MTGRGDGDAIFIYFSFHSPLIIFIFLSYCGFKCFSYMLFFSSLFWPPDLCRECWWFWPHGCFFSFFAVIVGLATKGPRLLKNNLLGNV